MPCSLLHIEALGKPRRLGLLGASVNKNDGVALWPSILLPLHRDVVVVPPFVFFVVFTSIVFFSTN